MADNGGFAEARFHSSSLREPLSRLIQLLMILQSERFPNTRRLAEACQVSRRTIYRDLAILEAAGIGVSYHPERQGYQLARNCWFHAPRFEDHEALALFIVNRLGTLHAPLGLQRYARSGLAKVVQSFPADTCERIAAIGELIADDGVSREHADAPSMIDEILLRAMSRRRRLSLRLWGHDQNLAFTTKLSLYRITRTHDRWRLVGYSSADRQVRAFDIAWIAHLELTDEPYTIPPRFNVERFLKMAPLQTAHGRRQLHLRFKPHVAREAITNRCVPGQKVIAGPDGAIHLLLTVDGVDDLLAWVIGFGDQVEVLEPRELRDAVSEWAERIVATHCQPVARPCVALD